MNRTKLNLFFCRIIIFSAVNLNILISNIFNLANFSPDILLLSTYYCIIYNDRILSLWFLTLLSIYMDIFNSIPIGINVICNLLLYQIVNSNINMLDNKPFKFVWFCLICVVSTIIMLKYYIIKIITNYEISINYSIIQLIFTILIYPIIHNFYNKLL